MNIKGIVQAESGWRAVRSVDPDGPQHQVTDTKVVVWAVVESEGEKPRVVGMIQDEGRIVAAEALWGESFAGYYQDGDELRDARVMLKEALEKALGRPVDDATVFTEASQVIRVSTAGPSLN